MDAQDFRSLQEAYLEVVENQQLDEDSRYDIALKRSGRPLNLKQAAEFALQTPEQRKKRQKELEKSNKKTNIYGDALSRMRSKNESVDLYDIILSHLLDEGYAETSEAAEVIMVNMSEEWRESIVEKSGEQPLPYGRMMKKSNQLADSDDPKKQKRASTIYLAANAPKGPKVKVRK